MTNFTNINDERLEKMKALYLKLYGKKPKNKAEFTYFYTMMNDISLTFEIDYDQITEEMINNYMKLIK